MRRFNRTPCYTGPDDPARGEVRDTLQLGETVIIETVRFFDDQRLEGRAHLAPHSGRVNRRQPVEIDSFEKLAVEPVLQFHV